MLRDVVADARYDAAGALIRRYRQHRLMLRVADCFSVLLTLIRPFRSMRVTPNTTPMMSDVCCRYA